MTDLNWVRGMIIDMDGVLWRGDQVLPGVPELFAHLRRNNIRFVLATNNATATPGTYQARMQRAGVEVSHLEIVTSALATAAYLAENIGTSARVLVIGDEGIRQALSEEGFELTDQPTEAGAVVAAMSRTVCWRDLAEATLALRRGVPFIGTNPDPSFPTERGEVPGAGAILAALEAASDRSPTVIGKPEPYLYRRATDILETEPGDTLIVGDRLGTDILGGLRLGAPTALMMTGVTSREMADESDIQANYRFNDLKELISSLNSNPE